MTRKEYILEYAVDCLLIVVAGVVELVSYLRDRDRWHRDRRGREFS